MGDRIMAVTFDTLKAATRLREEGGFSEKQATELVATFADGFVENLATKDDVEKLEVSLRGDIDHLRGDVEHLRGDMAHLRGDVEKLEVSLRGDMEKLETSLRGDMEKLEASLREDMGNMALRTDLEKTEAKMMGEMSKLAHRLTVRLGGAIGAAIGILVAVDKLF